MIRHSIILILILALLFRCNNKKDYLVKYPKKTCFGQSYAIVNSENIILEKGYLNDGEKNGVIYSFSSKGTLNRVDIFDQGSFVTKCDISNFKFSSRELNQNNSINLPVSWFSERYTDTLLVLSARRKKKNRDYFYNNILITKHPNKNFTSMVKTTKDYIENQLSGHIVAKGSLSINGINAYQYSFMYNVDNNSIGSVYTLVDNDSLYMIIGSAIIEDPRLYMEYKCLFQEVSNSFF